MDVGLSHGVAGMTATQSRLDSITQNLANLSTPAFKQTSTAIQSKVVGRGDRRHMKMVTREAFDFSQGQLERTGGTFDLALMGEGFFALETPSATSYTRNGSFRIDDSGVLMAHDGTPVAWEGSRGTLTAVGLPISIDRAGNVSQGNERVGKLRVVNFAEPRKLVAKGDGRWLARNGQSPIPSQAEVHQGAIEHSNVNSVAQLVELIQVQRTFESATNLMSRIDETYRRLSSLR